MLGEDKEPTKKLQARDLNRKYLENLLDPAKLRAECYELEVSQALLTKVSDFKAANESPRMLASCIVDQIERNNDLSTQMYFKLSSLGSHSWGSHLASLTVACIADIGLSLLDMVTQTHIHDLVSRGVQAQVCCSLVAVYQWIINLGPSLTGQLIPIHQSEGDEALAQKFLQLAPLVKHIVGFVRNHWEQQELLAAVKKTKAEKAKVERAAAKAKEKGSRGRPQKRKIGVSGPGPLVPVVREPSPDATRPDLSEANNPQPEHVQINVGADSHVQPVPEMEDQLDSGQSSNWSRIPADLFGLLPATTSTGALELSEQQ
ncbi:hypothetical protein B0H17DRAFT_1209476 [Mycena rosella]|uniref:Uncharacterized protein n=1 Tax=Mycena rosella TaxID=1033263 RepID=A0AAD7CYE7_MYCRO|nr:hypothetical protein B0H17DRAFT_1209476 [Mycena rosella]